MHRVPDPGLLKSIPSAPSASSLFACEVDVHGRVLNRHLRECGILRHAQLRCRRNGDSDTFLTQLSPELAFSRITKYPQRGSRPAGLMTSSEAM